MLMKRFVADSLAEAMQRARAECGEAALLLEARKTARGYVVVAAGPAAGPLEESSPSRRAWTRGFAPLAAVAAEFGLSDAVLQAIENALVGTRVRIDRPGDPALPRVATRVLRTLIRTRSMDLPDYKATAFVGTTG